MWFDIQTRMYSKQQDMVMLQQITYLIYPTTQLPGRWSKDCSHFPKNTVFFLQQRLWKNFWRHCSESSWHFFPQKRDSCWLFIDELLLHPDRMIWQWQLFLPLSCCSFFLLSWTKKLWAEQSAAGDVFVTERRRVALACMCHLWLLVRTRLSGCPLGSSLSLLISLSWRALRLLSRAASSSSSSVPAILRETGEAKKGAGNKGTFSLSFSFFFFLFSNSQPFISFSPSSI